MYTPEGQPSEYESMCSLAFVEGYIIIMDMQPDSIRKHMSAHLRGLMHDGQRFGWLTVRTFHAVWLQHIEQGRATWGDEVTRIDLCRSLVWHRLAPSSKPSPPPAPAPQVLPKPPYTQPTHA